MFKFALRSLKFAPLFQRRLSTSTRHAPLVHPDQIFANFIPPQPRPWASSVASPAAQGPAVLKYDWRNSGFWTRRAVASLQQALRFVHKHEVAWPAANLSTTMLSPDDYLAGVFCGIVDLFNQTHSPETLKRPMGYATIDLGDSIYGATCIADDYKQGCSSPIAIAFPYPLFDADGTISIYTLDAISRAVKYDQGASFIIITNYKEVAVFNPSEEDASYDKICTDQPALAFQVVCMALVHDSLDGSIHAPELSINIDEDDIRPPQGPPQDPSQPLISDEELLASHHRHSDFDMATLVRDPTRALQYLRWQKLAQQQCTKPVAHPKDTLRGLTNEVGCLWQNDMRPFFPFCSDELPPETTAHFASIQRESPLVAAQLNDTFRRSRAFTLEILDVIKGGGQHSISFIYRCQITSIDGQSVLSPTLCLKLFDDRSQNLKRQNKNDNLLDKFPPRWFKRLIVAESHALNETLAYDKLLPVQGSVIPWFFGMHQFTLPDGTVLYGLLMEHIEAWALDSDNVRKLSPDRQIKMIESGRHAVRALDVADVNRLDWYRGQLLLTTNPQTKVDHVVLVGFTSATQTWAREERNMIDNYYGMLSILRDPKRCGLDNRLVWQHFGKPDDWDGLDVWLPEEGKRELRHVHAKEMFPYITYA